MFSHSPDNNVHLWISRHSNTLIVFIVVCWNYIILVYYPVFIELEIISRTIDKVGDWYDKVVWNQLVVLTDYILLKLIMCSTSFHHYNHLFIIFSVEKTKSRFFSNALLFYLNKYYFHLILFNVFYFHKIVHIPWN